MAFVYRAERNTNLAAAEANLGPGSYLALKQYGPKNT